MMKKSEKNQESQKQNNATSSCQSKHSGDLQSIKKQSELDGEET